MHPWTSYLIVPLFALANAGVTVTADSLGDAAASSVARGMVVGLVLGKIVGVSGGIALAVLVGVGHLPEGITSRHVVGMAAVAGIGFTPAIFVAGLAFTDPVLTDQATIGVLAASGLAAGAGSAILLTGRARSD